MVAHKTHNDFGMCSFSPSNLNSSQLSDKLPKVVELLNKVTQHSCSPILSHYYRARLYWSLRSLASTIETEVAESEAIWREFHIEFRERPQPYVFNSEVAQELKNIRDSLIAASNRIESICSKVELFPATVDRLRRSAKRFLELKSEYNPLLDPEPNEEALTESKRQYQQGTLMDLETFVNGLRGV